MKTLIRNAEVWNGSGFTNTSVVIEDKRISFVGEVPVDFSCDAEIDGTGKYLLPGIIDCHAHVTMCGGNHHMATFFASSECDLVLEAAINCEHMLKHGITAARDCGGKHFETLALRNQINKGRLKGPHLICCGTPLKVIGGHEPGADFTGPNEARAMVRTFVHEGVDFIKAMVTGGLGKAGEDPGRVEMDLDELSAIVKEAKKHGLKVACHCHSREGMEIIVAAGADSIEHCTYLDPEINQKIIDNGLYIVPTFIPYENAAFDGEEKGLLMDTVLAARAIIVEKHFRFKEAYEQGVQIAFGRDSGGFFMDQGEFADEMLAMERAGMSRSDIIKSATENAARLLGIWEMTGNITEGKYADLLLLTANPLDDLTAFRNALESVYFEGSCVK